MRKMLLGLLGGCVLVAAVVGTWTMVATLAYHGYVERASRAEVLNAMGRMATAQESFRLRNRTYTNDLAALGFDDGCTENCVYLVSLDVPPNAETYTARFVPNPAGGTNGVNQIGDEDCQSFTIDALGRRSAPNRNCLEGR